MMWSGAITYYVLVSSFIMIPITLGIWLLFAVVMNGRLPAGFVTTAPPAGNETALDDIVPIGNDVAGRDDVPLGNDEVVVHNEG